MKERTSVEGFVIREYKTLDSTNSEARRYAMNGGAVPALFIAEEQTAGRGRMGRSFYSPAKSGLYMSLLLDVTFDPPTSVVKLTCAAAVASARAVERILGVSTDIKWVNDLYLNGKKVSGILAEAFSVEDKRYVVVGVGVNISTADFPSELENIATSLTTERVDGVAPLLGEAIGSELLDIYADVCEGGSFIEEYRARSMVLGKQITYFVNGESTTGVAVDITDSGGLVVEKENGVIETLASGEITLRLSE